MKVNSNKLKKDFSTVIVLKLREVKYKENQKQYFSIYWSKC